MSEILRDIQQWYSSQCDGDWEHENGIMIETLDNPGWSIKIDLIGTALEEKKLDAVLQDTSDNDWYFYKIENRVFDAAGDPSKLEFLLTIFLKIVENK